MSRRASRNGSVAPSRNERRSFRGRGDGSWQRTYVDPCPVAAVDGRRRRLVLLLAVLHPARRLASMVRRPRATRPGAASRGPRRSELERALASETGPRAQQPRPPGTLEVDVEGRASSESWSRTTAWDAESGVCEPAIVARGARSGTMARSSARRRPGKRRSGCRRAGVRRGRRSATTSPTRPAGQWSRSAGHGRAGVLAAVHPVPTPSPQRRPGHARAMDPGRGPGPLRPRQTPPEPAPPSSSPSRLTADDALIGRVSSQHSTPTSSLSGSEPVARAGRSRAGPGKVAEPARRRTGRSVSRPASSFEWSRLSRCRCDGLFLEPRAGHIQEARARARRGLAAEGRREW